MILVCNIREQSSDDVHEEEQASNEGGNAKDQIVRDIKH
jgi:hypothetical protein